MILARVTDFFPAWRYLQLYTGFARDDGNEGYSCTTINPHHQEVLGLRKQSHLRRRRLRHLPRNGSSTLDRHPSHIGPEVNILLSKYVDILRVASVFPISTSKPSKPTDIEHIMFRMVRMCSFWQWMANRANHECVWKINYRVTKVVRTKVGCWIDYDLGHSTACQILPRQMGVWQNGWVCGQDGGKYQIKIRGLLYKKIRL